MPDVWIISMVTHASALMDLLEKIAKQVRRWFFKRKFKINALHTHTHTHTHSESKGGLLD